MANTKYTTVDQVQTVMTAFANKADERFSTTSGEKACYDESTALYAHAVGDIVYVGNHFYKVTAAIAVGDTISTSTNITADTGIPADTPIYIEKLPSQDVDIPTKVSDLTNDLNFQTDSEVASSIASAIAGVTEFDYQIVAELPASGTKGIIYLVPNSGSGENIYDEYIWIVNGSSSGWEKFGEKTLSVVEYKGDGTYTVVVDGTGVDAGKKVIELSSGAISSLGKADSALQSVTSTGSTITVTGSGTTKNLEVASSIVSGATAGATAVQPGDLNNVRLNTLTGTLYGGVYGETDTTSVSVSALPYDFYSGSAVVYNDEIHILGSNTSGSQTKHYKWNGSAWSEVSTLPYDFYYGSAVVYNDEIHILGSTASGNYTKHYKWNGSAWSEVSTLPYDFGSSSAVVYNDEIHILGTQYSGNLTKHYKWNGSAWSEVSTLPYNFYSGSAVVYNNEIHILGGSGNKTKHYKWNGSAWSEVSTLPYDLYRGSAVVYNDEIHILGSGTSGSQTKHYKWNGSAWSEVSTLPYDFGYGCAAVYNNEIHILGGGSSNHTDHYRVEKLKITPSGWNPVIDEETEEVLYYFQGVDIEGLNAYDIVFVSYDPTEMETLGDLDEMTKAGIYCVVQEDDLLGFVALNFCPSIDIPVTATIQGGYNSIVNIPTVTIGEHIYDGTEQSVTISSYDPNEITVTGNTGTNVGNYECILTLKPNMIWSDGTVAPKKYPWSIESSIEMVSFSEGTDAQIKAMLDAYYDGILTLDEIKSVWSIGDTRTVNLSAMSATGVGESHRAQSVQMEILDFDHDELTTAINGKTKALISVEQKDCLMATGINDTNGSSNSEHGYMNSTMSNTTGWTNCARRTWCNSVYYNALPSGFKSMIKQVNKLTSAGNQSSTINTTADYIWLPSEIEIFGTVKRGKSGEGSQYAWYANAESNRYKSPNWNSSFVSGFWWDRSPSGSDATGFCTVDANGNSLNNDAVNARGLAPACCL